MEIKINQEGTRVLVPIGISSPNLGNRVTLINFLADTGADITTIGPGDALKIQLDFSKLKTKYSLIGVGGVQSCVYELRNVWFIFKDVSGKPIGDKLDSIGVIKPDPEEESDSDRSEIPSLLGTDMLQRLKFTYNSHAKLEWKK